MKRNTALGLIIGLLIFFLVALIGLIVLDYTGSDSTSESSGSVAQDTGGVKVIKTNFVPFSGGVSITGLTPSETYETYLEEFQTIGDSNSFIDFSKKYATQGAIDTAEEQGLDEFADFVFDIAKSFTPDPNDILELTEESVTGNTALVIVSLREGDREGEVSMTLEDGSWRIDKETWQYI